MEANVLDLVLWSFVIALTPVALGLAWKLISGIGDRISLGPSRAFESVEQPSRLRAVNFNLPSGSISMAGKTPGPGAGWLWAAYHRGPSRN
jgi:hypothetical protein